MFPAVPVVTCAPFVPCNALEILMFVTLTRQSSPRLFPNIVAPTFSTNRRYVMPPRVTLIGATCRLPQTISCYATRVDKLYESMFFCPKSFDQQGSDRVLAKPY